MTTDCIFRDAFVRKETVLGCFGVEWKKVFFGVFAYTIYRIRVYSITV